MQCHSERTAHSVVYSSLLTYMGTCGDRCGLSLAVRSGFEFVWVQALVAVAKGDALGGGLCTGLTTAPAPVASHRPWAGRQLHNTLVDRLHEPPVFTPLASLVVPLLCRAVVSPEYAQKVPHHPTRRIRRIRNRAEAGLDTVHSVGITPIWYGETGRW